MDRSYYIQSLHTDCFYFIRVYYPWKHLMLPYKLLRSILTGWDIQETVSLFKFIKFCLYILYVMYFSKVYFWFLFSTAYLLNIELRNLATYLISWWEDVHWQHISSWTSGSLWDLRPILCKNCDQRQPHHATCLILRGRHSSRECRYWVINTVNHLIKIWM